MDGTTFWMDGSQNRGIAEIFFPLPLKFLLKL